MPELTAHDPHARFQAEVAANIRRLGADEGLRARSNAWVTAATPARYVYNFTWLGRPVIQLPQDLLALQEIIWSTRPDVIVETGIAHGGSLIFSASMLELIGGDGHVIGVDIEIRPHNAAAIEAHPLAGRIDMIEGSSIDPAVVERVRAAIGADDRVMVILDSSHTHAHVRAELDAYGPFVTSGCYLVVLDTVIEDLPPGAAGARPWDRGNNPKTAVHEFVRSTADFVIDRAIPDKLMITSAPDGFLRCTRR